MSQLAKKRPKGSPLPQISPIDITSLNQAGFNYTTIAQMYGVPKSNIEKIMQLDHSNYQNSKRKV